MPSDRLTQAAREREREMTKVLEQFVPQMFSQPAILTGGAPDSGDTDIWMMSNIPAEALVPLSAIQIIGVNDERPELLTFVQLILRGVKGINGFNMKVGSDIALGLGGGIGRKVVKRPGLIGRNVTNRRWREKAEAEGAEIEE